MKKSKSKSFISGIFLFLREFFTHPAAVGATFPSSYWLARIIAEQIPVQFDGFILELGAGTGSITAGLLKHGIAPEKLLIVERSAAMVKHLQQRFPFLKIIEGNAQHLTELLNTRFHPICAVVSSLPLRTLPKELVKNIGTELENILDDNAIFIQFTYNFWSKPLSPSPQFVHIRSYYVARNLPPARVDIFKKMS